MRAKIEKKMNSADPANGFWTEPERCNIASVFGLLSANAATPSPRATTRANANATNIPSTEATLFTTALEERSEFRSSVHFSQIIVKSCDKIFFMLSDVSCSQSVVQCLCFDAHDDVRLSTSALSAAV